MSSKITRGNDNTTAPTAGPSSSYSGQAAMPSAREGMPRERGESYSASTATGREASVSGVSWAAIIGGALTSVSVSLVLLMLGSGLGLASVSQWTATDSMVALTVGTVIWLFITQWVAAGLGGYLTGRLRTKWVGMHTNEVLFRDTSHGFLSWAVATILTAYILTSAAAMLVSGGTRAMTAVASGAAAQDTSIMDPTAYYVDSLFRSDNPNVIVPEEVRAETKRILINNVRSNQFSAADRMYLAQTVAQRTGIPPQNAAQRVDYVVAGLTAAEEKVRQTADTARRAGANFSFFTFVSLLVGAIIASYAAARGGKHRDMYSPSNL